MTHIENLKPGQWVVVLNFKGIKQVDHFGREQEPSYDGLPHKILSICPPFVAVEWKNGSAAIDTRVFELMPVSWRYAKIMNAPGITQPKKKRKKEKSDPNRCPRCNTRFQRRIISVEGNMAIHVFCPECDYDNGILEVVS